ncbi:MAG: hypothetical protein NTV05_06315 [Acidobacteria bacterium]|nr:hypothetical protein [Acidobacteriota bacterium]
MRVYVRLALWMGLASVVASGGQAQSSRTGTGWQVLSSRTEAGWQTYVTATEARVARDRGQSLAGRVDVDRGQVFIERVRMTRPGGDLDVPGATVNHWRGLILIPGARLDEMLSHLEREPADTRQEDVLASAVLGQRPGWLKVSIRVHRSLVLSAVFDTEHEATFQRHSATRASSRSVATKIVEVDKAGTPHEREKRPDEDRGLLWRWNAYWRYEQVERGVLVECESLTLSRPVPMLVGPVVDPLVNKLAKESMERTLVGLRNRFGAQAARSDF